MADSKNLNLLISEEWLKKNAIYGIFEQLSTGLDFGPTVSMCVLGFGPCFLSVKPSDLKREPLFSVAIGLFQAIGVLCDHGADTRHRTDMGASCVLLAACSPATNALEEIFKRQGEAPDLRLDKIGTGREG